ncbi:MAG: sulfatase-like hydrolase/transferase [Saprospiraceae bacterium]|nr:sulfatase-like hydrolase/transferase [Saprospiraceae bacterium]
MTLPHAELTIPSEESIKPFLKANGKSVFVETPFVQGTGMSPTYSSQPMPNAATAAMIRQVDMDMGKLMTLLKELGLDKNTFVLFYFGQWSSPGRGRNIKEFESTGGLRGYKRDLYEGGIRVPTIAWGMGMTKKTHP